MEFGKISQVDHVNWTLPPDDTASISFLNTLARKNEFQVFMGTPAWAHKEWQGQIYPNNTKSTDFLNHYSRVFNCIELNTTHYQIPNEAKTEFWLSKVPSDFHFCPKIFQGISHTPSGLTDEALLQEWFRFLERLQSNLGPCFLQLPPHFSYSMKALLFQFLQKWPAQFELCLEFRHPSWFDSGRILPALTEYLQKKKIGLVITDVAGRRDVLHTSISADFTMLRFIGNDLHPSDYPRAETWAQTFSRWREAGLQRLFLMVHEPDDILAPEMADFFITKIKDSLDIAHPFRLLAKDQSSFEGL